MTNQFEPDPDEELIRARLNSETAKIAWSELQRFFAAGKTISVAAELDLIDVAFVFQQDDTERVQRWMQLGLISPVSDSQARDWIKQDIILWSVVVKPWVLVQSPK